MSTHRTFLCFALIAGVATQAAASSIHVDFGTDGDAVATGPGPADPMGGNPGWVRYTKNTAATGLSVGGATVLLNEYGTGGTGTPAITHTFANSSGIEDTNPPGSGFYGDDSIYGETVFDRPDTTGFAVLVSGLAAGDYDVYVLGVEQGQAGRDYNSNVQVGAGLTFTSAAETLVDPNANGSPPTEFVENENFARHTVTVGAGENIAVFYNATNATFTSLVGLQVVPAIPEPGTLGLVGLASIVALVPRRRQ